MVSNELSLYPAYRPASVSNLSNSSGYSQWLNLCCCFVLAYLKTIYWQKLKH